MNSIVNWFAGNRVAAYLVSITIILAGAYSLWNQKVEVFPEFDTEVIQIRVPYPGASPQEVEEGIITRIEERVFDLTGIDRLYGTATEGMGSVAIQVEAGHDVTELLDRVRSRVDAIDTLPAEAERPVVEHQEIRRQVIDVAISGPVSERVLKRTAERFRDDIMTKPGVTLAAVAGARPDEISIEVPEHILRQYGLTFQAIGDAIRTSSLDLPAGNLRTDNGEILVRTRAQAYTGHDFAQIPIITRTNGTLITLGDIATIHDDFAESDISTRFDGAPSTIVRVYRVGNQSALQVAKTVHAYVEEAQQHMPEGVSLTVWNDSSVLLRGRISLLLNNGWQGFLLVLITLAVFLKPRIAFWVALGIPVSLAGGLWLMPYLGVSINMISLFAFILVLGIVVDDAIVVGENITHYRQQDPDHPMRAARRGVSEVVLAVTLSVLTTVAMFAPMFGIPGFMGKIWAVIPAVAIPVLLFSLLESTLVLPSHLAHSSNKPMPRPLRFLDTLPDFANRVLNRFLTTTYRPFITVALRWRYASIASFIGLFILSAAMLASGRLPFTFFPEVPGDNITVSITMPPGSSSQQTAVVIRHIEAAALTLQQSYADENHPDIVRHIMASVASRPGSSSPRATTSDTGDPSIGEVVIALAPTEVRSIHTEDIAKRFRELIGIVPDVQEMSFNSSVARGGKPVDIQLAGPDVDELIAVANTLKAKIAEIDGTYAITDSNRAGKRELILNLTPAAETLGLRQVDIARQIRQAIYGEEAQRILRGRDEVKVMIRLPESERAHLGDIDRFRIRTKDGAEVPLRSVATVTEGVGFTSIQRGQRQRIVSVRADVDLSQTSSGDVNRVIQTSIVPELLAQHPSVTQSTEGEQREMKESMGGLLQGFILALYVCFVLMAILFKSALQPLIILSIIPFGLIGAVSGHLLMGMSFSMMSGMGMVALAGVEVNDSIVLVDFINRAKRAGKTTLEAVIDCGCQRFRPILLTTLTTFFGLLPVIIAGELSIQARFLVPMAVSLGFGGLFVTCITLILVPSLYLVVEDIRHLFGLGSYDGSERDEDDDDDDGNLQPERATPVE